MNSAGEPVGAGPTYYREQDVDPSGLDGLTVAVVGYGNVGRPLALNLRDSGVKVRVGSIADGSRAKAESDGFEADDIATAVAMADLTLVLVPDQVVDDCFAEEIRPSLRPGSALCFASGYALAFDLIDPPADVDVLLFAPRMVGASVREAYVRGDGFLSYLSVEQDASGKALSRLLGLAHAAGSLRLGALELSARQEATLDLLVEQTVGPYLGMAIQLAFQTGVDAGLPPEALVLEMYQSGEMAETFQAFARLGFYKAVGIHGTTAQYGGFLRTLEIDGEAMAAQFRATLADIVAGGFARKLAEEKAGGYQTIDAIQGIVAGDDPMSQAEDRARAGLGIRSVG
jgi:ketol-acid reductoisomerase